MNTKAIPLPRYFVLAALVSLFLLAFVFSPYWILTSSRILAAELLTGILCMGALWSYCAAGDLLVTFVPRNALSFLILFLGVLMINIGPLTAGLPWRGDEDFHVHRVLDLVQRLPFVWILCFALLVGALLIAAWHRSRWALPAGAALVLAAILFGQRGGIFPPSDTWLLRYPFVSYWVFMLVPKLASALVSPYHEILYRFIPLLAMSALAWEFQKRTTEPPGPSAFLWGLGVATVPLVFYYSSILYLDQLAAWLSFIVCLHIPALLKARSHEIRATPGWFALILIGFIKETAILFLLCFVACRLVTQWRLFRSTLPDNPPNAAHGSLPGSPLTPWVLGEFSVVIATCLPIILYLALRSTLANVRGFAVDPVGLLDLSVYRALGQSFLEQFGLVLILFAVGCILLARQRDYATLVFLGLVVVSMPLVTVLDNHGVYAGYSRFNLLVLPAILAGALLAAKGILPGMRRAAAIAPCILIAANLLLSPIHADGTKAPYWGNYLVDTSEHYYPYREALSWLKNVPYKAPILFAGMDYPYPLDFYWDQLQWQPRFSTSDTVPQDDATRWALCFDASDWRPHPILEGCGNAQAPLESTKVRDILESAAHGGFRVVVYQVLGSEIPGIQGTSEFTLARVFRNSAHSLMVFFRTR